MGLGSGLGLGLGLGARGEVGGVGEGRQYLELEQLTTYYFLATTDRQDLELEELDAGGVVVTAVEVLELVGEDAWLGVGVG